MKSIFLHSSRCAIPFVLILFFLSLLHPAKITAQEIEPTYISISQGLADPNVQDVIQDSYGLLWIATGNGLQSYDGYRFETFKNIPGNPTTILSSSVWGIAEDADRNIWVATENGIARYNRMNKSFTNYKISEQDNSQGATRVFSLFMDSQKILWAATASR